MRGVGKVVTVGGGRAMVEFFSSPSVHGRERESYPADELRTTLPAKGTRCFVQEPDDIWWIGRITDQLRSGQYQVVREGTAGTAPEYLEGTKVYVRCGDDIPDPVDVMEWQNAD
jgi:hypothetical protein